MEKRGVVNWIGVDANGMVVRFAKYLRIEDGEPKEARWHRCRFYPNTDIDAQMALVNAELKQIGEAEIPAEEIDKIKAFREALK